MALCSRSFSGETDMPLMIALSSRFPADHMHLVDLPYRLSSWALDDPENARLWFDETGQLIAWAALQTPFWTIDLNHDPTASAELLPPMLAWAEERARALAGTGYERPSWFVPAFAGDLGTIHALEVAGFDAQADMGENAWSKVLMERPGPHKVKDFPIPAGFTVRPLVGEEEVDAYVDLHQAVFETKNMTVEWRRRTLQHPDYRPDLDLVVEAPDGRLAAFCIAWIRQVGDVVMGQIEPLGSHVNYSNRALGRLALAEALRRLQAHGAQIIRVETDNYRNTAMRLYESLGFRVKRDVWMFRKDL